MPNSLGFSHVYITTEEQKVLAKQIYDLLKPYENRRGIEGEQQMMDFMAFYPYIPSGSESSHGVSPAPHHTWAISAVDFSRADLEKALAEGERLRIDVVGVCRFADDIPADLVEQTVEHFHLTGKLFASPAVRKVLQERD